MKKRLKTLILLAFSLTSLTINAQEEVSVDELYQASIQKHKTDHLGKIEQQEKKIKDIQDEITKVTENIEEESGDKRFWTGAAVVGSLTAIYSFLKLKKALGDSNVFYFALKHTGISVAAASGAKAIWDANQVEDLYEDLNELNATLAEDLKDLCRLKETYGMKCSEQ